MRCLTRGFMPSSPGFQIAESMGFKDDFRQWEHLLRIGD